ncbi:MAG: copper-binding protein [Candidatus Nitrosopumilus limneticus]|nr:copper-binding protein [Candidatus Nitrosopumilus limneticus]
MKFLLLLLLIPFFIIPVFAESQILSTDKGTLNIKLSYEDIKTSELTRLPIEFINPMTQKTQVHIDYKIMITESGKTIFQTPNLIHTSEGIINGFKFEFPKDGTYNMKIDVEGILFTPITPETVSFDIVVGEASAQPINPIEQVVEETVVATQESEENGGGCLIATATYGSELAPQVQLLREIRDNQLLNTESGSAFMKTFNDMYYTFSPTIADWERESPIFKEIVKAGLTPMLSTLSIMENTNSESEVLGLGLSVIALNLAMYIGIPAIGIVKVIQFRKN